MSQTSPDQPRLDMAACEALMRSGSKSFFAASSLLPARLRTSAIALYAFCRVADDAIDLHEDDPDAMRKLQQRLDNVYVGCPSDILEDQALMMVVRTHHLPRALLDALLEGFSWDAAGRRYETIDDLHGYCARVAGSVGAMMGVMMGVTDTRVLARACELGNAMQLTNIARDVGEDARNGRLYLPRAWMREAGLDPDLWLKAPSFSPALASVIGRLLLEADRLYKQASTGVAALPRDCRSAILAAAMIYAEIGHTVANNGMNSLNQRAVVSKPRKLTLLCLAKARAQLPGRCDMTTPPLPAIAFLIDACSGIQQYIAPTVSGLPQRSFDERCEWVIDLFERVSMPRREI
jgi:phytoene synthase